MKNLNKEEILNRARNENKDEGEEYLKNKYNRKRIIFIYTLVFGLFIFNAIIDFDIRVISAILVISTGIEFIEKFYKYKYEYKNSSKEVGIILICIYLVLFIISFIIHIKSTLKI
ncbi:MAG: DUF6442 family protein [Miniphocaeibacter sp.]|uniref:DUF6442 family protein n=1 Tax=Miniphocaeibacter sp. TaxID=3100973 RepID=UPI001833B997|nr:hypothetical protein [Gallicola sp.]